MSMHLILPSAAIALCILSTVAGIYFVSNADRQIGSLSTDLNKVVVSFGRGKAWAYALADDPAERARLEVDANDPQLNALYLFKLQVNDIVHDALGYRNVFFKQGKVEVGITFKWVFDV